MSHHLAPLAGLDIERHAGEHAPTEPPPKPSIGGTFQLDAAVIRALPIPETEVTEARKYGMSLWGHTAKVLAQLPSGEPKNYFLKMVSLESAGRLMIEGEFASLKAIHTVSPEFVPEPYAWGRCNQDLPETYFLLTEFREVGEQPPDPIKLTAGLADLHKRSVSPTGKFGFHKQTCHAYLPQMTNLWEESWSVLYQKQLAHLVKLHDERHADDALSEFQHVCRLTIEKVIPRLLEPLQSEGRSIKPCLVHGDLWDENTATDAETGEPFIFDAGSFYAHNEYDIGNWRSARHRLSNRVYVDNYKKHYPISEPENEWDDRNLLYSLTFDLGAALLIPGCNLRQV
ncbi:hypothetical protein K491DRAFT_706427 [Lophiostoma macrostomum CBS 122681]|uniref:protein-ribulosamine 3-kinase n=1 Tax=Lophiostoma macrostomum CBS 122681 TaxID=1314788 RepID=A0A6A6SZE7_9PLEO|nr:hypothetical protein K491DRAFT_706427 [Lophiostoma macrostomum CBS 122681]